MTSFELSELNAKLDVMIGFLSRLVAQAEGSGGSDGSKPPYWKYEETGTPISQEEITKAHSEIRRLSDTEILNLARAVAEPIDLPSGNAPFPSAASLRARPFPGMLRAMRNVNHAGT